MRVLSVQVGRPRTVGTPHAPDPMDRAFTSAIWKEPVQGTVWAGSLGLRGDSVADTRSHGGPDQALLMYAATHYPLWRAEWGRDDLGPGSFGENLTVEGITEDQACIGDVLEIGQARFQVSHPRQPCSTLARRHQVRNIIEQVNGNGRSGWYLRVLEEGCVEAGLPVRLADRSHPEWSVRRAARAMLNRHKDCEEAHALASCEALSKEWRKRLAKS
jgi:MOSC domain-containing protein YiiM